MKTLLQRLGASKLFNLAWKFGLTLGAFAYVFSTIDPGSIAPMFYAQDHGLMIAALLLVLCQLYLGGLRWRMIAIALAGNNPKALPHGEMVKYTYISIFFNCCLPGTVGGDVVRVWLARSELLPLSISIYSVVIDRLISLLALALLILIMLPLFSKLAGFALLPVLGAAAGACIAALLLVIYFSRLSGKYKTLRLLQMIGYFIDCLKMLARHKKPSLLSLLFGVFAHICYALAGLMLAKSLSIPMNWLEALTLFPPVLLITTLPISVGGWGVREASAAGLLGLIGVAQAAAVLLSIQLGLLYILISLPAGFLWLATRRHRPVGNVKQHEITV